MKLHISYLFCIFFVSIHGMKPTNPASLIPTNKYPPVPTISWKSYTHATVFTATAGLGTYLALKSGINASHFLSTSAGLLASYIGNRASVYMLDEFNTRRLYNNLVAIDQKVIKTWQKFNVIAENASFLRAMKNRDEILQCLKDDYNHCKFPVYSGMYHARLLDKAHQESCQSLDSHEQYAFVHPTLTSFFKSLKEEHKTRRIAFATLIGLLKNDYIVFDQELAKIHNDPLVKRLFKSDLKESYDKGHSDGFSTGYVTGYNIGHISHNR